MQICVFSSKGVQCQNLVTVMPRPTTPYCYTAVRKNIKTCLTTFLDEKGRAVRKSFEDASRWCKASIPGSSLIAINSPESQSAVESFIHWQVLETEAIVTDARMISEKESHKWSWVNGIVVLEGKLCEFCHNHVTELSQIT